MLPSFPTCLGSSSRSINCSSEGSPPVENQTHCVVDQDAGQVTIDMLPDDALLYVFDFYVAQDSEVEAWHTLVHVCRRWRILVFGSPRRLNLRIECTGDTPVRERLDIWPSLPIIISGDCNSISRDNIKATLEHHDRVCQIVLSLTWEVLDILEALEEPFPILTVLELDADETSELIFPNPIHFLGGFAHLRSLSLIGIPISGLPKLLSSFTDLVNLRLTGIIISIFVSPDEMVTALSALTRLQVLHLGPELDESHPDWQSRHIPLPTRTVLPSLIELKFVGVIEYLDDFMARIDAPLLGRLEIVVHTFLDQDIVFNTPQILQFISRVPKFQALDEAHIGIHNDNFKVWINFLSTRKSDGMLDLEIICIEPERQFPCLAQFPLPTLKRLYIDGGQYSRFYWQNDARWLELLQPFTSVKDLYLSEDFAQGIAPTLGDLSEEIATEVLPALENVLIEKFWPYGPVDEAFQKFVATRRLSVPHIVVSDWDRTGREAGH